jgi:NADP-dependent 3-hydroxy acid dehydrogenase YdfG
MTEIRGANTLITGATGGIGEAIARHLAGQGARVVLSGRRVDVLDKLAADIGGQAVAADLGDQTSTTNYWAGARRWVQSTS